VHGRGFQFAGPEIDARANSETDSGTRPPDAPDSVSRRPTVAVLPFVNQNRDPDEDYFADGITEDIITALSRHRWLNVVARNPAFAFRDSKESIRTIGAKLDTNYLVTGSIRRAGSRFRITVQVVDSLNEQSVWSERFDRDMVDVFELQDEISALVAARIEAELGLAEQQKALKWPRKNLGPGTSTAWRRSVLQVHAGEQPQVPGVSARVHKARSGIRRRPFETRLRDRAQHGLFRRAADRSLLDEALAVAKRAIELDDRMPTATSPSSRPPRPARIRPRHRCHCCMRWNSLVPAVTYCGLGDSLAYEGRLDEAIQQFETAIRLSPHDPFRWAFFSIGRSPTFFAASSSWPHPGRETRCWCPTPSIGQAHTSSPRSGTSRTRLELRRH